MQSNMKVGCGSAAEQCQEICAVYCERFGWEVDRDARKSWITQYHG